MPLTADSTPEHEEQAQVLTNIVVPALGHSSSEPKAASAPRPARCRLQACCCPSAPEHRKDANLRACRRFLYEAILRAQLDIPDAVRALWCDVGARNDDVQLQVGRSAHVEFHRRQDPGTHPSAAIDCAEQIGLVVMPRHRFRIVSLKGPRRDTPKRLRGPRSQTSRPSSAWFWSSLRRHWRSSSSTSLPSGS